MTTAAATEMERTPTRVWTHTTFDAQALAALGPLTTVITTGPARDNQWFATVATCDALILDGVTLIDGPAMDRIGPHLRIIARTGIGIDRISVGDATERGII